MKRLPTKILSAVLSAAMIFSFASIGASAKSAKPTEQKTQAASYQNAKTSRALGSDEEEWDLGDEEYIEFIDSVVKNHICFDLYSNFTATVSAEYNMVDFEDENPAGLASGNITIPSSVKYSGKSYTVTVIGNFSNCENLESITFPSTITDICDGAFDGCAKLSDIVIPQDCVFKTVGSDLFNSTPFGDKISDQELVILGKNALYSYNKNEASYTVPEEITIISGNAFACTDIANVTLSSKLVDIGDYAFANCTKLNNVVIPDSVRYLGLGCFKDCTSLSKITLGSKVEGILDECFSGTAIETINIPASVEFCDGAFANCTKLRSFSVDKDNETLFDKDGVLFENSYNIDDTTSITLTAYPMGRTESTYAVPFEIDYIASGAFSGAKNIKSVDYSKSTSIIVGPNSFENSSIESIDFSKISWINDSAFCGCNNLKKANLSNAISISDNAFLDCENLANVTFSDETYYVGCSSFSGTALETVSIKGLECDISAGAFSNCPNLKEITLGDGVWHIGEKAFYNCPSLETVSLSKTIILIDDFAFDGCENVLFKVIKRSEAYKAVKAEKLNFEVVGSIPLIVIIFNKVVEFFRNIFWRFYF